MIDLLLALLNDLNGFLYGKFLVLVLICVGVYFTIRTGVVQIRLLPEAIRVILEKPTTRGSISSFQALMIATASRVGTGNIAGVATALVAGGPGAMVWMWIMCLIGGASAFVESTLAQIYKKQDGAFFKGGPAYYIECSTTAIIVLLAGSFEPGSSLNGIPLVQQSVASVFGEFGIHMITVAIFMFAFTSIIGNYFYAEANIKFISQNKVFMLLFKLFAVLMVFVGAQVSMTTAWDMADVLMGLMATVNILAIVLLGKIAFNALADYEKQKKAGKNPVFRAADIGLTNTDLWK